MSKLTDESVAKALGAREVTAADWKRLKLAPQKGTHYLYWNGSIRSNGCGIPPFTTYLDAIVPAIESRGTVCITWCVEWIKESNFAFESFALALVDPKWWCRALLAYLKEQK
jgi:hypothetical protein